MSKDKWISWMSPAAVDAEEVRKGLRGDTALLFKHLRHIMALAPENGPDGVREALHALSNPHAIPPFLWYQAALEFPALREDLHFAMLRAADALPPLKGKYFFLIDVSTDAQKPIHDHNLVRLMDVAAAVASMARDADTLVFTVSDLALELRKDVNGIGFIDACACAQPPSKKRMADALYRVQKDFPHLTGLVFDGRDDDFLTAEEIFFNKFQKNQLLG